MGEVISYTFTVAEMLESPRKLYKPEVKMITHCQRIFVHVYVLGEEEG